MKGISKEEMAQEPVSSSPRRRAQGQFSPTSPTFRRAFAQNDISCASLLQRHRFLLTALALLTFLCTIYLYFAVTLGNSCSGLIGDERELCRLKHEKESFMERKLKML